MDVLKEVGRMITRLPPDLHVHRALKRVYDARAKSIETGQVRGGRRKLSISLGGKVRVRFQLFPCWPLVVL